MVVQNLDMHFSVQTNIQFKTVLEEVNLNITSKVHCIMGKITLKATQMKKRKAVPRNEMFSYVSSMSTN